MARPSLNVTNQRVIQVRRMPVATADLAHTAFATAPSPLRQMIDSRRSAGPTGFFAPRSQSDTRFFDALIKGVNSGCETCSASRIALISSGGRTGAGARHASPDSHLVHWSMLPTSWRQARLNGSRRSRDYFLQSRRE